MKKNVFLPSKTYFDLVFEILSQTSGRPHEELVKEFGDAVLKKAKDPELLLREIPWKQYNRILSAGKMKQTAFIGSILEDSLEGGSTHFWTSGK